MALILNNNLAALKPGDYFWIKYVTATSGAVGIFSDIAKKTDADVSSNILPVSAGSTPNGYFRFICVGYNTQNKPICIADRNIQYNITWDELNTNGIASGSGVPISIDNITKFSFIFKLFSGGILSSDADNIWSKTIGSSTLDGAIAAGDNNVWNFSAGYCWTSSSPSNAINRVARGSTISSWTYTISSGINNFRPMLIIDNLTTYKFLIEKDSNYYTINSSNYDSTDTHNFTPLSIAGGAQPNNADYDNFGFDNFKLITSRVMMGNDYFVPVDKFLNNFKIRLLKY